MGQSINRVAVILITAAVILLPIGLIFYQSILSGAFFLPRTQFSLEGFGFVLSDPAFWRALRNSLLVAIGMVVIAVPLGGTIAFLTVRTDLPGRRILEPMILAPILVSPIVLAVGYVIAAGPVGFYSGWFRSLFGFVPWNIYSPISITIIGGLTHVPYIYIYTSSALRGLSSDVDEAARVSGASAWRVAADVSLPMIRPALIFGAVMIFFAGIEMFGLALVLGNTTDFNMLAIYLYKLTSRLGLPAYHLMAVVAIFIILLSFPLILLQRYFLRSGERFVSIKGKAMRQDVLQLGRWRAAALSLVLLWLFVTAFVPISGIILRAFSSHVSASSSLFDVLTIQHFQQVLSEPALLRGVRNSLLIGIVGGALAVAVYTLVALSVHRRTDGWTRFVDYLILVPRVVPGLLMGLAFLWVFIFFPPATPLRATLISIWIAYTVVWLAYGTRLVSSSLMQVGKELEEAARITGASPSRSTRDVTLPLSRHGLLASWLLVFLMFEREYATGVYLLTAGNELIGPLLVSLSETGAMDQVAALSFINLVIMGVGITLALKFGVKLNG